MKNTRRFISAVMALVMAAGTTMYVSAEDVPTTATLDEFTSSGSTEVKYSVDPSYTVVIPASVTLSDNSVTNATISVSGKDESNPFKLGSGQTLSVNIADVEANDFKVNNADQSLDYTVTSETSATPLAKGSTAAAFTNDDKIAKTLIFSQMNASAAKYAGDYTGTLTFTIALTNPTGI